MQQPLTPLFTQELARRGGSGEPGPDRHQSAALIDSGPGRD
jgi:hypothetical protein